MHKLLPLALLILSVAPHAATSQQAAPGPVTVAENASQPAITCDKAGNVYVAYGQGAQDARQIMLSVSKDGGKTFGEAERVSVDALTCFASMERGPRVAVLSDGGIAVTCFAKLAKGGESHLYCYRKGPKDKAFKGMRVTPANSKDAESMHDLCLDGEGRMHLVWQDARGGKNLPYFACSTDGGKSFKGEVAAYSEPKGDCPCCCPSISASANGKKIIIQFRNTYQLPDGSECHDMAACVSENGGKSFKPAVRLDSRGVWKTCPMDGGKAAMSADGKQVAHVWMSDFNGQRRVMAQLLEPGAAPESLAPLGEAGMQTQPDVIWLADGKALLACEENSRIKVAIIGSQVALSEVAQTSGDQHYPALAQLPDGGVLVAFEKLEKGKSSVVVAPVALANGDDAKGK